jgi:maltooligosyltrehalose trehalohydrolase
VTFPHGERLGATPSASGTRFCVWAPRFDGVAIRLTGTEGDTALSALGDGYFGTTLECGPGTTYRYVRADGATFADPASRFQPEGVHGPSAVVDLNAYQWSDRDYRARPLWDHVIYELHVGTFRSDATFDEVLEGLDDLVELGVTAIELMPVAQFPGARNWGYDGVFAYAVQNSYGGPDGLQRFVDGCHARGLAVVLDVVYNHLGPEGNVLGEFGPYFNEHYQTPWGPALNFDEPSSDDVREYYWQNVRQWFEDFHVDALRLDAVHAIIDTTPIPFIAELSQRCRQLAQELGRPCDLVAESASNDPRTLAPSLEGGLGMDAQWNDDFHHALHVALTGERTSYYVDYDGAADLARAMSEGFVYQGTYSPFRQRRHGAPSAAIVPERFVVFAQNHDQVGNRPRGDRLSTSLDHRQLALVAALVLLSPNVPLLFMGEEYGETAPFPYFVDHGDPELNERVREGRAREFPDVAEQGALFDPTDPATFLAARLQPNLAHHGEHRELRDLYRRLIELRRATPALRHSPTRPSARAWAEGDLITLVRTNEAGDVTTLFNVGSETSRAQLSTARGWRTLLGAGVADEDGAVVVEPWSFCVLEESSL